MIKENLGFIAIIKQSINLISSNPNFIFLTFLTSFPLFLFSLSLESNLLLSLPQIFNLIITEYLHPSEIIIQLIEHHCLPFLLPGILHLAIYHSLDLINTITTIHLASSIYAESNSSTLKQIMYTSFKKVRSIKGPLITSIYALVLSSLTLVGIVSLLVHCVMSVGMFKSMFSLAAMFFLGLIALVIKYMEWSGIWSMGMVISVLEEKHGDVAIGVSAYISRGNRTSGFLIVLMFVVWTAGLRLICLYGLLRESENLVMVVIGEVGLVCVGNVVKWVAFTVYYYDCKKRFLHKKVDVEQETLV